MSEIFVLIANEQERVKECIVVRDSEIAHVLFHVLQEVYGGANVAMWARAIDAVPVNIQQAVYRKLAAALCSEG